MESFKILAVMLSWILSASPCTVGSFTIASYSWLSDHSDSAVSPPVTCVDAVTVHLHSQCSGACSDVQETAEVQS